VELQNPFVQRVLQRLPSGDPREYVFSSWNHAGRPTDEGVGLLPSPGADPKKVLDCVMDVDHYVGNVAHVVECRAVPDDRFQPPQQVRFYQRIKIPLLGQVHHELVLERIGEHQGWEIAAWTLLDSETRALNKRVGIRSQYNEGAWLVKPGYVCYALSSCPLKDDVGFLKWKAMTKGGDVAASTVIKENIAGMSAWAARRQ
jgi:hypothetical protein